MQHAAPRISSQHRQLDVFFGMVLEALKRSSAGAARLAFTRFSDALEAHISLEDQIFFPALNGLHPASEAALVELVKQHQNFRERIEELHGLLAEGSLETFSTCFDALAADITVHEGREENLVAALTGASPLPTPPAGPFDPTRS